MAGSRACASARAGRTISCAMLCRRDLLGAFSAYALLAELGFSRAAQRASSTRTWLDR